MWGQKTIKVIEGTWRPKTVKLNLNFTLILTDHFNREFFKTFHLKGEFCKSRRFRQATLRIHLGELKPGLSLIESTKYYHHVLMTWGISCISQSCWLGPTEVFLNGFSPYTWSLLVLSASSSTRAQYSRFTAGLFPPNSAGKRSWWQWLWRVAMLLPCTWILKKQQNRTWVGTVLTTPAIFIQNKNTPPFIPPKGWTVDFELCERIWWWKVLNGNKSGIKLSVKSFFNRKQITSAQNTCKVH